MLHLLLPPALAGKLGSGTQAATNVTQPTVADVWIWAAIVLAGFLVLAIISALLVNYRPGGGDKSVRRIWFWIFAILTPIASFLLNFFTKIRGFEDTFRKLGPAKIKEAVDALTMQNVYSAIAVLIAFIAIGWVLSVAFKRSKLGTWF